MSKEIEVNWKTNHKEEGEIIIKTIDLENDYVWTNSKKYPTFGIDSIVAKECYPSIPVLLKRLLKQFLQPNKEQLRDEIISELNEQRIMFGRWNYEETNNSFISTSNVEIKVKRDCISNLNNTPLPLASKIIKYFQAELNQDDLHVPRGE